MDRGRRCTGCRQTSSSAIHQHLWRIRQSWFHWRQLHAHCDGYITGEDALGAGTELDSGGPSKGDDKDADQVRDAALQNDSATKELAMGDPEKLPGSTELQQQEDGASQVMQKEKWLKTAAYSYLVFTFVSITGPGEADGLQERPVNWLEASTKGAGTCVT